MQIIITKEQIEDMLGTKIEDFRLKPLYKGVVCIGLTIEVITVSFKLKNHECSPMEDIIDNEKTN